MLDCTRDLRTYELDLGRRLGAAEKQAVSRSLTSKRGIRRASFSSEGPHGLTIEYDADVIGPLGLRELVLAGGVIPVLMRPAYTPVSGSGDSGSNSRAA